MGRHQETIPTTTMKNNVLEETVVFSSSSVTSSQNNIDNNNNDDGSSSSVPSSFPMMDVEDDDDDRRFDEIYVFNDTSINNNKNISNIRSRPKDYRLRIRRPSSQNASSTGMVIVGWFGSLVRILVLDLPLVALFASLLFVVGVDFIATKYFVPQIQLMSYVTTDRELEDSTYYNRYCTTDDVSATSLTQLQVLANTDTPQTVKEKMLTHGVIAFPERLLSKATCDAARTFIVAENDIHPHQWGLLEGRNRHAWGIDMNMDPSIRQIWKELSSNPLFVESIEAIVGKDPAVVEFTAITAKYKAKSQKDHADVMAGASATQQARSFLTSYSLFIPLQDTTKDMGATSICPGTHLCNDGASVACYAGHRNLIMTGEKEFDDDDDDDDEVDDDDSLVIVNGNVTTTTTTTRPKSSPPVWEQGTGMMYNQQVTHKGRAHTQEGGPDRVVLILTFAPRPTTSRGGLETRIIPLSEYGIFFVYCTYDGRTFPWFARFSRAQKFSFRNFGFQILLLVVGYDTNRECIPIVMADVWSYLL
jgi:hypothetical protein